MSRQMSEWNVTAFWAERDLRTQWPCDMPRMWLRVCNCGHVCRGKTKEIVKKVFVVLSNAASLLWKKRPAEVISDPCLSWNNPTQWTLIIFLLEMTSGCGGGAGHIPLMPSYKANIRNIIDFGKLFKHLQCLVGKVLVLSHSLEIMMMCCKANGCY